MKPTVVLALLLALAGTTPAPARVGETMAELKARYGKPAGQPQKDIAMWLFETVDGQLLFTATFNAAGRSIAEGLKPVKHAQLTDDDAHTFIETQLGDRRDAKTTHEVPPRGRYTFAGKEFVRGENEYVVLNEAERILVIWSHAPAPSVIAVAPEMLQ